MSNRTYTRADWEEALKAKDIAKLEEIVNTTADECGRPNSYCLTEVFCPDCPMGLLVVQSWRGVLEQDVNT